MAWTRSIGTTGLGRGGIWQEHGGGEDEAASEEDLAPDPCHHEARQLDLRLETIEARARQLAVTG
ncbi:hypothetical protein E2562_006197 [Oryza meyeriana var. granulata]|uniref:Uncharacterized protein n=1 Tax=Oryza meyeriana var. granulata TaxID=110450 RepID=A0A6G1CMN2_9ORYZ|nr:hypothetical protein E2562_006197 [Oryza meyeriana var. granulata]